MRHSCSRNYYCQTEEMIAQLQIPDFARFHPLPRCSSAPAFNHSALGAGQERGVFRRFPVAPKGMRFHLRYTNPDISDRHLPIIISCLVADASVIKSIARAKRNFKFHRARDRIPFFPLKTRETLLLTPHLVYHVVLVEHVWIEESVPEPDVAVHLPPLGRHPGEHGPDERVAEAEGSRGKLVEDGRVAGGVVLCVVALCVDTQVVEVHVVPADDAREELVEGDVLGDARHDATAFLVQGLVGPVRVDALNIDDRLFFTIEVSFKFKSVP
jgi:hypothetical protein